MELDSSSPTGYSLQQLKPKCSPFFICDCSWDLWEHENKAVVIDLSHIDYDSFPGAKGRLWTGRQWFCQPGKDLCSLQSLPIPGLPDSYFPDSWGRGQSWLVFSYSLGVKLAAPQLFSEWKMHIWSFSGLCGSCEQVSKKCQPDRK